MHKQTVFRESNVQKKSKVHKESNAISYSSQIWTQNKTIGNSYPKLKQQRLESTSLERFGEIQVCIYLQRTTQQELLLVLSYTQLKVLYCKGLQVHSILVVQCVYVVCKQFTFVVI